MRGGSFGRTGLQAGRTQWTTGLTPELNGETNDTQQARPASGAWRRLGAGDSYTPRNAELVKLRAPLHQRSGPAHEEIIRSWFIFFFSFSFSDCFFLFSSPFSVFFFRFLFPFLFFPFFYVYFMFYFTSIFVYFLFNYFSILI